MGIPMLDAHTLAVVFNYINHLIKKHYRTITAVVKTYPNYYKPLNNRATTLCNGMATGR